MFCTTFLFSRLISWFRKLLLWHFILNNSFLGNSFSFLKTNNMLLLREKCVFLVSGKITNFFLKKLFSAFLWNVTFPTDHNIKTISREVTFNSQSNLSLGSQVRSGRSAGPFERPSLTTGKKCLHSVNVSRGFQALFVLSVQWFLSWATVSQPTFLENFRCCHYVSITSTKVKKCVYCSCNSKYSFSSSKWVSSDSQLPPAALGICNILSDKSLISLCRVS